MKMTSEISVHGAISPRSAAGVCSPQIDKSLRLKNIQVHHHCGVSMSHKTTLHPSPTAAYEVRTPTQCNGCVVAVVPMVSTEPLHNLPAASLRFFLVNKTRPFKSFHS